MLDDKIVPMTSTVKLDCVLDIQ